MISVARNQRAIAEGCHVKGVGIYLGEGEDISPQTIKVAIEKLTADPQVTRMLAENSYHIVDGRGASRVGDVLLES
jgi:spore coat polysaccharide biosynthesis predicted glycosyltransferase SpsG